MFAADWALPFVMMLPIVASLLIIFLNARENWRYASVITIETPGKNPPHISVYDIQRAYKALDDVCARAQCPRPKLRIVRNNIKNATAGSQGITLTVGIIRALNDMALRALIAHELTHILNKDSEKLSAAYNKERWCFMRLHLWVCTLILVPFCTFFLVPDYQGFVHVGVFWGSMAIAARAIWARYCYRRTSRIIEYAADAGSVRLTSVLSARLLLECLGEGRRDSSFKAVFSWMMAGVTFIVDEWIALSIQDRLWVIGLALALPLWGPVALLFIFFDAFWQLMDALFSTHPLNHQRLAAIR